MKNGNDPFESAKRLYVQEAEDYIVWAEKSRPYVIISDHELLRNSTAWFYRSKLSIVLELKLYKVLSQVDRKRLFVENPTFTCLGIDLAYTFSMTDIDSWTLSFMTDPTVFKCSMKEYKHVNMAQGEKLYHRMRIATSEEFKPGSYVESEAMLIGPRGYGSALVSVELEGRRYQLYSYEHGDEKKWYYHIESASAVDLDQFILDIDIIQTGLGFVSGKMPREEMYIVSANDRDFRNIYGVMYKKLSKSLYAAYGAVPSSPERTVLYMIQRRGVEQKTISRFINEMSRDRKFYDIIMFFIETNTLSNAPKAVAYTVVLEAISELIMRTSKHDTEEENYVSQAKKKMRKELQSVVERYINVIGESEGQLVIKKLQNITKPTNRQRLRLPFEIVGLKLTDEEYSTIALRNDYLHGRLPGYRSDDYDVQQQMLTLYNLCTALILRYIGYHGPVVYRPGIGALNKYNQVRGPVVKII